MCYERRLKLFSRLMSEKADVKLDHRTSAHVKAAPDRGSLPLECYLVHRPRILPAPKPALIRGANEGKPGASRKMGLEKSF